MTTNGAEAAKAAKELAPRIDNLAKSLRRHRAWTIVNSVTTVLVVVALALVVVNKVQSDRRNAERRIANRAVQYAGCQEDNRKSARDDKAYQTTLGQAFANPASNKAGLSRSLDQLRDGLNQLDCEWLLRDLAPTQASEVRRQAAAIPRLPLPPPTVPGYVPPDGPS